VEKGEFFMVEARRKQADTFDDAINATGVIIYSVKEESAYINADGGFSGRDYGNMYGDGDYEVSLFLNPSAPINYFTGKQGFNALEDISFRDGTSSGVSVTGITANGDGSFSFNVTVEGQPPKAFLPEVKMLADNGVLSFAWECGNGGKTYVMAINATPKAAARYALDDLPSAKSVVRGKGEGLDVLYVKSMPSAVRRYLPKVSGECYFVVVTENALGEIVDYNTFHVGVEGQPYVQAGFGDFIFASLRVGNPAFIAVCGVGGLCVLVGIVGVVLVRIRRRLAK
jgi:hypothetical protein